MSEEQIPDTIEKLYDRLDDYDKQQLMNYGYLMEYTKTLEKEVKYQNDIVIKQKEELNDLYNADQSERNYKVFIEKVDKLLEEINGRNI